MKGVKDLNYRHYISLEKITVAQAQLLLATFRLNSNNIFDYSDQDDSDEEYNNHLKVQMRLAGQVIDANLKSGALKCSNYDERGELPSIDEVSIDIKDFCFWAKGKKKYELPDPLCELIKDYIEVMPQNGYQNNNPSDTCTASETKVSEKSVIEVPVELKDSKSDKILTDSNTDDNSGGRPEETLAEVVRHVYKKLSKMPEESWRLKKGKVWNFIEFMRFMSNEKHPLADQFVMDRIELIKAPQGAICSIKTKERKYLLKKGKRAGNSNNYNSKHVTRILMRLRAEPQDQTNSAP